MKQYDVAFEVEGPFAMFARPDTGATPVSYPVPTWSAAKGMFEAVAPFKHAYIRPTRVEICAPIRYERYVTNYRGPLRESGKENYQLIATILADVRYRIHGVVEPLNGNFGQAHALQEIFQRRLKQGRLYYTPCLGWKEFVPTYFGELREETKPEATISLTIPSLLRSVFDSDVRGKVRPSFFQNVAIENGVMLFENGRDNSYA
jgi:CRISPR-associated protein Cas5d